MVAGHEPIRGFDCRAVPVEQVHDQLGDRDRGHVLDALRVVENVLVGRPEFSIPIADEPGLFDQIQLGFDICLPHIEGGRRREQEALMDLFGLVGREGVAEIRVANGVERSLQ